MADHAKDAEVNELLNDVNMKSSTMTIVIVVILVLTLAGAGAAGYFFFLKDKSEEGGEGGEQGGSAKPAAAPAAAASATGAGGDTAMVGIINRMDPFIVNLNEVDASRYLKVTVELEVSSEETVKELDKRGPQIRDLSVGILSSKSFADIQGADGKYRLKEELMFTINKTLTSGQVKRIYFTAFVVQ
ncbi:MAG: flagellar basal body-associated FliL family protein [Myxococcota bacterium]